MKRIALLILTVRARHDRRRTGQRRPRRPRDRLHRQRHLHPRRRHHLVRGVSPANGRPIHDTTGTTVLIIHGFTSPLPGFEQPVTPGFSLSELTTCTGTISTAAGTLAVTVYGILTPQHTVSKLQPTRRATTGRPRA
jgi:hypothetical protein